MEDIAGIISQFATYLSELIKYIMSFLGNFNKKDEAADEAAE